MIPQISSITPEEMVAGCRNLISLPESCLKIRSVLEDPEHHREDIAALIMLDPSLCARTLRIVNSAYYGLPNRISEISSALGVIGEHDLNNLILVTSIIQTLKGVSSPEVDIEHFWKCSLMNGVLSRQIASRCLPEKKEQLFVAGLLLDVGQLIMYRNAPGFRDEVFTRACMRNEQEYIAEQDLLGFDHGVVGGVLASIWQFPDLLIDTITYHHQVGQSEDFQLECKIVNMADGINGLLGEEDEVAAFVEATLNNRVVSSLLEDLKISRQDLQEIVEESRSQFQEVHEALFGSSA